MNNKLPYKELLLEHYHHPRNKKTCDSSDFGTTILNPSCGDQVVIHGIIENAIITEIYFDGKGCVICLASASILTTLVKNQSIEYALLLSASHLLDHLQIALGPTRMRCALLPLESLHQGLLTYQGKHDNA